MNFKPLHANLLVKRTEAETKTSGGLFIPGTAQGKTSEGLVMAVGPGHLLEDGTRAEMPLQVGDKVMFERYSGHEIKLDSEEYLILKLENILGVIGE